MREARQVSQLQPQPGLHAAGKPAPRRLRLSRTMVVFGILAVLVAVVGSLASAKLNQPAPPPAATAAPVAALTAHGIVQPVARATVATMSGGVVRSLRVQVGQTVTEGQLIAQVSTPEQTETLVAPWGGTVMGLAAHLGDTLLPGAPVATVGDLSRYQVETTDVDEYLIGRIHADQQVTMTVEALDGRKLEGSVETVGLVQETSGSGVASYPVVIQLDVNDLDLRPGMTVRIVFSR